MTNKTLLLTLLFVIGFSFQNCVNLGCDCCFPDPADFFDIQDMYLSHLDNDRRNIENGEISIEDYGYLNMSFSVDYIAQQEAKNFHFSLINPVYGCTPPEAGTLGSKTESFVDIQIITLRDFDDDHLEGSVINDLFELEGFPPDQTSLNDFLENFVGNVPNEWFPLKLTKKPTLHDHVKYKVTVELSDNESYELETDLLRLL